jgi:hypothetical protein
MDSILNFFQDHTAWAGSLAGLSVLMLIGSALLMPKFLLGLPADYFYNPHHVPLESYLDRPAIRFVLLILKNMLGLVLFLAGLSMLVLPGQGLLTLLVAGMLLDFPGKFALKKKLISVPRIRIGVNRFRERHGKQSFTA